jgi:choline dehydrogenase-like flavoprotein
MAKQIFEDEADYVIVGTGAGGATAARVLAGAGLDVAMIEEGPWLKTQERPTELVEAMARTFRDFGTQTTTGATPIPLLQGRLVGGSTAINSGIIWRMPEDVRADWRERFGLGAIVDDAGLDAAFTRIEDELEIGETDGAVLGGNSSKMEEASKALGLPGRRIVRNAKRCQASAHCLQGCPGEARQSMDVSYVPRAIADGARLHEMCAVEKVIFDHGRAVGVEGVVRDRTTRAVRGTFRVRSRRATIIAASAVFTPVILRRSGLRGMVGERFQAHPGAAIVGRFPEPIGMGFGATQGYEIPMRTRGFKLESLSLPPEMLAARLPGAGAAWQQRLGEMDHYAQWVAQVRMSTLGRVRPTWAGGASVAYAPSKEDLTKLRDGLALICKMMFAAGATEIYPGLGGVPEVLSRPSDVAHVENAKLRQGNFHMMASHLFGTACAGSDPRTSVVGADLQSHQIRDLYVMDASVFPTNMGVNPQHSIMAVVWRAAERLANRAKAAAA